MLAKPVPRRPSRPPRHWPAKTHRAGAPGCAAAAGLIAVRRCKKRLWLYGALAGTLYAVLAFIVFSAVAGTLYVSIALLSDIAIGAVSGLLSVMVLQMLK